MPKTIDEKFVELRAACSKWKKAGGLEDKESEAFHRLEILGMIDDLIRDMRAEQQQKEQGR